MIPNPSPHDRLLVVLMVVFISGSLVLAILDPGFRPQFAELAKIAISGFLGWMMPRS